MLLLQRSLAGRPITTSQKHVKSQKPLINNLNLRSCTVQHLPRYTCCVAAADAAQAGEAAAADGQSQITTQEQQHPVDIVQQQQQEQEQDQQQASSSGVGMPPGPMEPPDEEPKKLSAAARLSEALVSTSITIFGDDTELNWAVCQALSKKIGWFPVSTRKVLLGLQKAETLEELIARDGRAAVVEAESKMLKGMRDQLRCCISTIGDGAAADAELYPNLYGTILIWLDEEDKRSPKAASVARSLYQQQAEIRAKVDVRKGGFGEKAQAMEDKAATVASRLIKSMLQLLKDNKDILARKRLYLEYGCRGDWPELKPQDWNPVLEGLERKVVS